MGNFKYQALDSKGREVSDFIEASNNKEAISKIRRMGLFPTKVRGVSDGQVEDAKTDEVLNPDRDAGRRRRPTDWPAGLAPWLFSTGRGTALSPATDRPLAQANSFQSPPPSSADRVGSEASRLVVCLIPS